MTMSQPAPDDDLTLEFVIQQDGSHKVWCLWRGRDVLALEPTFDAAMATAKRIARADRCQAWLMDSSGPIPIDLSQPDRT